MSTATPTKFTPEDLLTMPDGDRYELVDGELVERNTGQESSWIGGKGFRLLGNFAEDQGLGWVFPADASYQCFPDDPGRVRKPDASFIRRGRLPNELAPTGHCRIAPDLAVEVVSPNDLFSEVEQKVLEYLEAGISLVWVVSPESRRVMVYRPDGSTSFLNESANLSGEDVIAGFTCPIRGLFPPQLQP